MASNIVIFGGGFIALLVGATVVAAVSGYKPETDEDRSEENRRIMKSREMTPPDKSPDVPPPPIRTALTCDDMGDAITSYLSRDSANAVVLTCKNRAFPESLIACFVYADSEPKMVSCVSEATTLMNAANATEGKPTAKKRKDLAKFLGESSDIESSAEGRHATIFLIKSDQCSETVLDSIVPNLRPTLTKMKFSKVECRANGKLVSSRKL